MYFGKVESGPISVKDDTGKIVLAWEVLYDDGDKEEMNIEELLNYHCEDDLSNNNGNSIDLSEDDGKALCDEFFDDGGFG